MEILKKHQVKTSGTLKGFLVNKHKDIDAFELIKEKETVKINFPPHTAKAVMNAVKQNETVTLTYEEEQPKHNPGGNKKPQLKLQLLTNAANSDVVIKDIHLAKGSAGQTAEDLYFENFELIKGKKDELIGIRSGKQLVHVHKEDQEIAGNIKPDSKISVKALKRTDDGFINEDRNEVYHIREIVIDGQTYKTKN